MRDARLPGLDVLRGVAILLVLLHHPVLPAAFSGTLRPLALAASRFGWTGVDLFFVLSGFLVGGLLARELAQYGDVRVGRFLVRRAFKIWPSYVVFLAVLWAQFVLVHPRRSPVEAFLLLVPNLLHLQNYLGTPRIPTWSLAVEEHFYLVLPVVMALLARTHHRGRWLTAMAVGLGVTCLALRLRLVASGVQSTNAILFPSHLRLDALFFGVWLAWIYRTQTERLEALRPWRRALGGLGVALVSPMTWVALDFSPFVTTVGLTMLYLGYGCIVLAVVLPATGEAPPVRWRRALATALGAIGAVSYPMYLWFLDVQSVFRVMGLRLFHPAWMEVPLGTPLRAQAVWWAGTQAAYVGAVVAAGWGMSRLVERPLLAVRDRLYPSRIAAP